MNLQHLVQMAASVANVLTVVIFGIGYYMMIRLYREWVRESRQTREAGGRPQVVVAVDHSHLPQTNIVVRNFNRAPAKDVSFHFAAPIESPDGTVISELPYFRKGLHYLEPEGNISRPWGQLSELAPLLREGARERHRGDGQVQGPCGGILRERVDARSSPFRGQRDRGLQGHERSRERRPADHLAGHSRCGRLRTGGVVNRSPKRAGPEQWGLYRVYAFLTAGTPSLTVIP